MGPIPAPLPPPPRRLPAVDLPPYRYVPGLNPHPFRHPDGHLYTDGSAPEETPWDPTTPWESDALWLRAWDLHDQRYYWEAHEAWEALWHQVGPDTGEHPLLKGLIQGAACVLKTHLGHEAGAARLEARAALHLGLAAERAGPIQRGLDLPATTAAIAAFRAGGPWPLLATASSGARN